MSFCLRDLSVLAYANGFTLWHYKAPGESLPAVERPGYFDDAVDMLTGGDMMLVSARDGGRVLCIAAEHGRLVATAMG